MVCANVNESFMQLVENCSITGSKMPASHLASSWWKEPTMDKIGLIGVPTLCFRQSIFVIFKNPKAYLIIDLFR